MRSMWRAGFVAAPLALAAGLAGCAGPIAVKPMLEDAEAYSARYFSPAQLTPGILAQPGAEPLGFHRLVLKGEFTSTSAVDEKKVSRLEFESTLINAADTGGVREITRFSSNGIFSYTSFELRYHGLVSMAMQNASVGNTFTVPINYVLTTSRWDRLNTMAEHATMEYRGTRGIRDPLVGSTAFSMQCRSDVYYDAATVVSGAPGKAINVDCDTINRNGVKWGEFHYVWLDAYKTALPTGYKTSNATGRMVYRSLVAG